MANPVMNSIVKDWSTQQTTPAGYPAMPGYQPPRSRLPTRTPDRRTRTRPSRLRRTVSRPVTAIRRPTASSRSVR